MPSLYELLNSVPREAYIGRGLSRLADMVNSGGAIADGIYGGPMVSAADLVDVPDSYAGAGIALASMVPAGKLARRLPRASDLFHGTSNKNLQAIHQEGVSPYGKAYVSPFPEIADDIARERVFGLDPNGGYFEGGKAVGGQPTLIVLDRQALKRAGVKFERDPEMNLNGDDWRDVGALMTTWDSAPIPPEAIKRSYVGEEQIRKALAEYSQLKERMAKKTGRR